MVSSAKLQASVSLVKSERPFIKSLNKTGPNTDPCRIPFRISR